jgi:tRNA A-37 threonylcarbamoyl transferase component Bud32/tetratricopeptide (TPR) repeat protein
MTLTAAQWRRVDEIYDLALGKPEVDRAAFVESACADPAVRAEVQSLLRCTPGSATVLHDAVASALRQLAGDTMQGMVGRRLGAYRLTQLLGEGGMGAVYLAERADAEFRRQVAIKVMHHGLGSPAAIARFRDERQILAGLDHPGIVGLLDGGTEQGVPYLVMEIIDGVPITHARELPVRDRLVLAGKVCDALAYAHARHIVHRDIKPSNILVGADGVPKLLDFGIAKLVAPDGDREARTRTGLVMLTPAYASPEQARGESVTAATDIYSFGAVLYELLVGSPPLQPTGSPAQIARVISEVEPPPPSTVVARDRSRQLAGDLDNIVMMALAKDPSRRYATIQQLADDLGRHLAGKPVLARPPSLRYRASKLVKRRRGTLAAIAIGTVAIVGAFAVSGARPRASAAPAECAPGSDRLAGTWDRSRRALIAGRFAASDREFVRATGRALVTELDLYADRWSSVHQAACRAGAKTDPLLYVQRHDCLDDRLRFFRAYSDHLTQTDVDDLALRYDGPGNLADVGQLVRGRLDPQISNLPLVADCEDDRIVRAQPPPLRDAARRAQEDGAMFRLQQARLRASGRTDAGTLDAEERAITTAVDELAQLGAPSVPAATTRLAAFVRFDRDDPERGDAALERAIELADRSRDDTTLALALTLRAAAHLDEAEAGRRVYAPDQVRALLERADVALERAGRPADPAILFLTIAHWHAGHTGQRDEATRIFAELIAVAERGSGARSLVVAGARAMRSRYLRDIGEHGQALAEARQAQEIRAGLLGESHPRVAGTSTYLEMLLKVGRAEEALRIAERWQPILTEAYGPRDLRVTTNLDWIGHLQTVLGHLDDAVASYRACVALRQGGPARPLGWSTFKLGEALTRRGRALEGLANLQAAEQLLTQAGGVDSPEAVRGPRIALVESLVRLGQLDAARLRLGPLLELAKRDLLEPRWRAEIVQRLPPMEAVLVAHSGDLEGGERLARAALADCHPETQACWSQHLALSMVLALRGRHGERITLLRSAIARLKAEIAEHAADENRVAMTLRLATELGRAQLAAGDARQAVATLEPVVAAAARWATDTWVPDAGFALAQALVASNGDRVRARDLVLAARAAYVALGDGKSVEVLAADAWLAAHR